MALRWNMQIMLPSWIPAVREAWMNAEDVDYSEVSIYIHSKTVKKHAERSALSLRSPRLRKHTASSHFTALLLALRSSRRVR